MRILLSVFILSISSESFSSPIESGFYNQRTSNCSNNFVKLDVSKGSYLNFSRHESSASEFHKDLSLMYDVMTELDTGELVLQMGGVNFILNKSSSNSINMTMHHEDNKPVVSKLYKCDKFDESTMEMFNDLQAFSVKYPEVNFGVGYKGDFMVQP